MSEGPIKQWRDGFKSSKPIPAAERIHFHTEYPNRAYCGTTLAKDSHVTEQRVKVTCPNCSAALRADEEARS